MFKVLGTKKLVFILLLVLLSGGAGAGYYYWLLPYRESVTQELDTTRAAVEARRLEVAKMKEEFVLLQSQLRRFKELESHGFFDAQARDAAEYDTEELSRAAGTLRVKIKVSPGDVKSDPVVDLANRKIVKSSVIMAIDALDDVDVYSFVKFVKEKFPGDIDITGLKLKRTEVFNQQMLRFIGTGNPAPLVTAELTFDWLTMAPKDLVQSVESGNQ